MIIIQAMAKLPSYIKLFYMDVLCVHAGWVFKLQSQLASYIVSYI